MQQCLSVESFDLEGQDQDLRLKDQGQALGFEAKAWNFWL